MLGFFPTRPGKHSLDGVFSFGAKHACLDLEVSFMVAYGGFTEKENLIEKQQQKGSKPCHMTTWIWIFSGLNHANIRDYTQGPHVRLETVPSFFLSYPASEASLPSLSPFSSQRHARRPFGQPKEETRDIDLGLSILCCLAFNFFLAEEETHITKHSTIN